MSSAVDTLLFTDRYKKQSLHKLLYKLRTEQATLEADIKKMAESLREMKDAQDDLAEIFHAFSQKPEIESLENQ